jgi:hypothetical protein
MLHTRYTVPYIVHFCVLISHVKISWREVITIVKVPSPISSNCVSLHSSFIHGIIFWTSYSQRAFPGMWCMGIYSGALYPVSNSITKQMMTWKLLCTRNRKLHPSHCRYRSYIFFRGNWEIVFVFNVTALRVRLPLGYKEHSNFHCTFSTSVRQNTDVTNQQLLGEADSCVSSFCIIPVKALWPCKFNFSVFQCGPNIEHSRYYEIYFVLLPIWTVAMAVKEMCKYCGRISGSDLNPHSHPFCFKQWLNFNFSIWVLKFQLQYTLWYRQTRQP